MRGYSMMGLLHQGCYVMDQESERRLKRLARVLGLSKLRLAGELLALGVESLVKAMPEFFPDADTYHHPSVFNLRASWESPRTAIEEVEDGGEEEEADQS
jgi:hypothetical protein